MKTRGTVAFVSLEIYPTTAGGVGILVHHTIRFLLSAGYEIVLLLDVQPHEFERFSQVDRMDFENGSNLHVYNVRELCANLELPGVGVPHSEMLRSAQIGAALEWLCTLHDIEMVEFYDYCGPAYSFLGTTIENPPAVAIRLHNTIELIARKIRSARESERTIQFAAERQSLMGADLILSSGQKFYDWEIEPLYPEIDRSRVQMSPPIHAPVGTIKYSPLSNDVAFYGRLSTFKGLDRFIKGAVMALRSQEFSDWLGKFLIMGPEETVASAYSLEEMKGFIPPEFQNRFEFTGRVDHATLMRRLEDVAFACFANRMESFCYAAHELHTAGVPLILSDTATFRDHFYEGETALFFDSTGKGLAERMVELSQNQALRTKLSAAGRARPPYYMVDYYEEHLAAVRAHRARPVGEPIAPLVLVLSNGDRSALERTMVSIEACTVPPKVLEMRLDSEGGFRFSGQSWSLYRNGNERINHALTEAPEAVVLLRAGDRLSETWLTKAATLMGRREDVGAVAGWMRNGRQVIMGSGALLPEGNSHFEPGLRCMIRLNARDTLQDAMMSRPYECEASLMLALRHQNKLTLTLSEVSCDIDGAIDLPQPSFARLLDYDFDRISRDYIADNLSRLEYVEADSNVPGQQAVQRSQRDPGFFSLRAIPQAELGGGDGREVLFLRYFPDKDAQVAPWSMLRLEGGWSLRSEPGGPVGGALRTETGSATGYVGSGGAADVLVSPWAGQLEVIFNGERKLIDLRSNEVTALRIVLDREHGILARPVIARGGESKSAAPPAGLALTGLPRSFMETGRCDTVILCRDHEDLESWPLQELLEPRVMIADADMFASNGLGGACPFAKFAVKSGVSRVLFSSKLAATTDIERCLRALPETVELGLALCGSPHFDSEGETLLAHLARWYGILTPYMDRISCVGGPRGVLDSFRAQGASVVHIPSPRMMRWGDMEPVTDDAPVSLALLSSDQPPRNLMHMFNAVLVAAARGLKIDQIYLPESYRHDMAILDHFHLDVALEFFADASGLAFVGEGTKRIAMCSYPQEYFPPQLAEATALGWLPLAGAVTEFEGAPAELGESLSEPYWENATMLAEKLFELDRNYTQLMGLYKTFVSEGLEQAEAQLGVYLTLGGISGMEAAE